MDKAGVVRRGVEIGGGEDAMFSANLVTIAALKLVDGNRSADEILRALTAQVGRPVGEADRDLALAALKTAHAEGATRAA